LALAQMELQAFNVEFNILNNLSDFELTNLDSEKENLLIKRLAYSENINGKVTDYYKIIKHNITKSINQYLTHWIYPYKGKFHPQMIRALLNIIGLNEGDTVLDPFVGSGTTAVEAQLLGINCIGIDISPLCVLQSKVKVESIFVLDKIKSLRDDAIRAFSSNSGGLSVFLEESTDYNGFLESIEDERVRNFFLVAKLIALSDQVRRKRKIVDSFIKNLDMMIKSTELYAKVVRELDLKLGMVKVMRCDARELPLEDNSVDGIITSPPYSIALDYVKNDAHALKALGYDLDKIREEFIGVRGTGSKRIELYNRDMIKCLNEMHRVLKPDRFCVIVIGNATYQGREIKTVEFIIDYCQRIGFKLVKNIDKIIYGLYNVMQKENILIFRKVV
jgi:DNA modification methylase